MIEQPQETANNPNKDPKTGKFLPGNRANPGGRPKGSISLTTILRELLAKDPKRAREIVETLLKQSKQGDMKALQLAWERLEGKVPETHKIEGDLPIQIVFQPASSSDKGMAGDTDAPETP